MSGTVKLLLGVAVILAVAGAALLMLEDGSAGGGAGDAALTIATDGGPGSPTDLPDAERGQRGRLAAGTTTPAADAVSTTAAQDALADLGEEPPQPLPVTLTGQVVDGGGRPVPQARVVFHAPGATLFARRFSASSEPPQAPETATDGEGRFQLPIPLSEQRDQPLMPFGSGAGRLVVAHPAFTVLIHDCPRLQPGSLDLGTLVLDPGASVAGRLVDENGRPVAGARVTGRHLDQRAGRAPGSFLALLGGRLAEEYGASDSGADGSFRVTGLEPGVAEIAAEAEGYQLGLVSDLELEPGLTAQVGDVVLSPGAAIAGWVLDQEGRPVAGAGIRVSSMARLVVRRLSDVSRRQIGNEFRLRAETDSQGWFELAGLAPGQFTVHTTAEGFAQLDRENVAAGTADLRLMLQPLGGLLLTLRAAGGGQPIEGARVRALPGSEGPFRPGVGEPLEVLEGAPALRAAGLDEGDGRGLYFIPDVGSAGVHLEVLASGYAADVADSPFPAPGQIVSMSLDLEPESVLSGRVVDDAGAPVEGALVSLAEHQPPDDDPFAGGMAFRREIRRSLGGAAADSEDWRHTQSDQDGIFSLHAIPAGEWDLTCRAEGFVVTEAQLVTLAEGESRADLTLVLAAAGSVAGLVSEQDGTPVSGAQVLVSPLESGAGGSSPEDDLRQRLASVFGTGDGGVRRTSTDGAGGFLVGNLAPGPYEVKLASQRGMSFGAGAFVMFSDGQDSSGGEQGQRLEVLAHQESWVDLVRPPTSTLNGQVLAGGRALEGVPVSLDLAGAFLPMGGLSTETDRFGRYEFRAVDPGDYEVSARAAGAALPAKSALQLVGGRDATVDLVFSGATLQGRVVDADTGRGVSDVTLNVEPAEASGSSDSTGSSMSFSIVAAGPGGGRSGMQMNVVGGSFSKVVTDAEGGFRALWLPPGDYTLETQGGGYVTTSFGPLHVKDESLVDGVLIEAERGAELSGLITSGDTGQVLDSAPVSLTSIDGGERQMGITDAGRYHFDGLAAGEYSLTVQGSGFGSAPMASQVLSLAKGEHRSLDMVTEPGGGSVPLGAGGRAISITTDG